MPQHDGAQPRCFRLCLLGQWQLVADGEDVGLGHREERLVALLGLTGRSNRLHVAGILWPESTDVRALASLRSAVLRTQQRSPGLLQADRLTVGLEPGIEVDVAELRRAAAATEDLVAAGGAAGTLEDLVRQLAGAELLPGWYDDWVLPEREHLAGLRVKAFARIARHALETGDLTLALDAARAATDADPLLEPAAELAIRAHLARGDLGSAVREFTRYRDAVREELGAPPSRTILELIEPALEESQAVPGHPREPAPKAAPGAPAAARALVPVPAAAPAAPRTVAIPRPPREPVGPPGSRGVVARLLAAAAMILAAALAVAGSGAGRDGRGAPGDVADAPMPVLSVDHAIRASTMAVRLVDAGAGRAAFRLRTMLQPALVRLELRGGAGVDVVRSVLVRGPAGRRLEVGGLDPGTYRWLATSKVAAAVSGRLRIPEPPVAAAEAPTVQAAWPATTAASTAPVAATAPAGDTAAPGDSPSSDTPSSDTPTGSPQPSGTAAPSPAPHHTTGQPNDPGTSAPGPVG